MQLQREATTHAEDAVVKDAEQQTTAKNCSNEGMSAVHSNEDWLMSLRAKKRFLKDVENALENDELGHLELNRNANNDQCLDAVSRLDKARNKRHRKLRRKSRHSKVSSVVEDADQAVDALDVVMHDIGRTDRDSFQRHAPSSQTHSPDVDDLYHDGYQQLQLLPDVESEANGRILEEIASKRTDAERQAGMSVAPVSIASDQISLNVNTEISTERATDFEKPLKKLVTSRQRKRARKAAKRAARYEATKTRWQTNARRTCNVGIDPDLETNSLEYINDQFKRKHRLPGENGTADKIRKDIIQQQPLLESDFVYLDGVDPSDVKEPPASSKSNNKIYEERRVHKKQAVSKESGSTRAREARQLDFPVEEQGDLKYGRDISKPKSRDEILPDRSMGKHHYERPTPRGPSRKLDTYVASNPDTNALDFDDASEMRPKLKRPDSESNEKFKPVEDPAKINAGVLEPATAFIREIDTPESLLFHSEHKLFDTRAKAERDGRKKRKRENLDTALIESSEPKIPIPPSVGAFTQPIEHDELLPSVKRVKSISVKKGRDSERQICLEEEMQEFQHKLGDLTTYTSQLLSTMDNTEIKRPRLSIRQRGNSYGKAGEHRRISEVQTEAVSPTAKAFLQSTPILPPPEYLQSFYARMRANGSPTPLQMRSVHERGGQKSRSTAVASSSNPSSKEGFKSVITSESDYEPLSAISARSKGSISSPGKRRQSALKSKLDPLAASASSTPNSLDKSRAAEIQPPSTSSIKKLRFDPIPQTIESATREGSASPLTSSSTRPILPPIRVSPYSRTATSIPNTWMISRGALTVNNQGSDVNVAYSGPYIASQNYGVPMQPLRIEILTVGRQAVEIKGEAGLLKCLLVAQGRLRVEWCDRAIFEVDVNGTLRVGSEEWVSIRALGDALTVADSEARVFVVSVHV